MEQGQTEIEAISAEITLFRQKYLLSVSFCSFGYLTVDFCFLPKLHILKPPLSVSAETLSVAHFKILLSPSGNHVIMPRYRGPRLQ